MTRIKTSCDACGDVVVDSRRLGIETDASTIEYVFACPICEARHRRPLSQATAELLSASGVPRVPRKVEPPQSSVSDIRSSDGRATDGNSHAAAGTVVEASRSPFEVKTTLSGEELNGKTRPTSIICEHCGERGEVKAKGPVPRFCSPRCRSRNRRQPITSREHPVDENKTVSPTSDESQNPSPPNGSPESDDATIREVTSVSAPTSVNLLKLAARVPETSAEQGSSETTPDDHQPQALTDLRLLRRSLREARRFRVRIAGFFILSLLSTPLALLSPVPLAIAVDSALGAEPLPSLLASLVPDGLEQSPGGALFVAAVLLVVVALLSAMQELATAALEVSVGEKLTLQFQSKLLKHVQRLSFAFHDSRGTADSIYRIQHDAGAIQAIAVRALIPVVTSVVTLVSMIVIIMRIDIGLAAVALGVSPLLAFYTRVYRFRMRPRYKQASQLESSALKVVQEVLTSMRVVKAFGREEAEQRRFEHTSSEGVAARIQLAIGEGAFALVVNVTVALGTAVVLYVGVNGVQKGSLTLGALLLVLSYVNQLYGPLRTLSNKTASLQRQLAKAERAFSLLEESPDVRERLNAHRIKRASGAIELHNVSFGYGDQPNVLERISLSVPAGTRVGLAGPTGVGKTTLVSLLARFYDPRSGRILLDGIDLRDCRIRDLRAQFTFMLQEPVLFSTSIADNVAYARPGASYEDIVTATRTAGAHEFVSALPDGYNTVVGERGMSLSGGERQRLSLARAFLSDAPILILDEPTSSVDVETEAGIMEAMHGLMAGRTTFMIAHRTGTLDQCDRIWKFENRRIVDAVGHPAIPSSGAFPATSSVIRLEPGQDSGSGEQIIAQP